jgi:hypothetical protein
VPLAARFCPRKCNGCAQRALGGWGGSADVMQSSGGGGGDAGGIRWCRDGAA